MLSLNGASLGFVPNECKVVCGKIFQSLYFTFQPTIKDLI